MCSLSHEPRSACTSPCAPVFTAHRVQACPHPTLKGCKLTVACVSVPKCLRCARRRRLNATASTPSPPFAITSAPAYGVPQRQRTQNAALELQSAREAAGSPPPLHPYGFPASLAGSPPKRAASLREPRSPPMPLGAFPGNYSAVDGCWLQIMTRVGARPPVMCLRRGGGRRAGAPLMTP